MKAVQSYRSPDPYIFALTFGGCGNHSYRVCKRMEHPYVIPRMIQYEQVIFSPQITNVLLPSYQIEGRERRSAHLRIHRRQFTGRLVVQINTVRQQVKACFIQTEQMHRFTQSKQSIMLIHIRHRIFPYFSGLLIK